MAARHRRRPQHRAHQPRVNGGAATSACTARREDVAPNLSRLAQNAVVFDNAYAVYPESIKGLFSILCSRPPAVDTSADRYASVSCPSMAAELGSRLPYRRCSIPAGSVISGWRRLSRAVATTCLPTRATSAATTTRQLRHRRALDGRRILRWIDAGRADRPFFVTYLPIAGHHPYETPSRGPFPDGDDFGRYRNALHYGDAALGALIHGLEARGLDGPARSGSCLGDHGEAFGQHEGNYGHTFQLSTTKTSGCRSWWRRPVCCHTRFGPAASSACSTRRRQILDLLGMDAPRQDQGSSMLDGRSRRALFFSDYSLMLAGLRDGPRKIISDLRSGRSRWFDVEHDPAETVDLAARHPEETRRYAQLLAEWVAVTRADRRR